MVITGTAAAIIAAVSAVAAGTLSAVASVRQGQAANQTAKFNARVLEEQAQQEQLAAQREAEDERRRGSRLAARLRAGLAGAGLTNEGTPLLSQQDLASATELSARQIEVVGNIRDRRLRQNAALQRFSGRNKRDQSFFSAGTSILGTVRQVASSGIGFGSGAVGDTGLGPQFTGTGRAGLQSSGSF